ncbi:MAG TPA: D-glycero-beta-D-manno-heptose-7-phosphate kinase [Hyphomicrobiaceae bacterium]|nr:D-glycero-beta-D-manno-heptose-7-phosphate kinase [Hyphomicrobiaceae bacterium]
MIDFRRLLSRLARQRVLCVGDLIIDEFVYGKVSRISPEAATPVLAAQRSELHIGGAGNVARNITSLGAKCDFVGVIGGEPDAYKIASEHLAAESVDAHLVTDASRPTTRKIRFVSEHYSTHLLRTDWESAEAIGGGTEQAVLERATAALPRACALLLSDYAKGVLTHRVVRTLITAARQAGLPIVVDPKGHDYSVYRGATLITPNRQELAQVTRLPVGSDAEIEQAAAKLSEMTDSAAVVVTRSEDGMSLYRRGKGALHISAHPVRVRDVAGAGDTVVAALATFLAAGADFEPALRAANAAASVVVGKRGTATVSAAELRARLLPAAARANEEKILVDHGLLAGHLAQWRRDGMRIGFTNGCFDLLHPGHIRLLVEARAACDKLIVGLNSDASVARLKGRGRPVQNEKARAEVLAALEAVDLVVIFDEPTPIELIRTVRPAVLVKGSDYRREEVVGRDLVEAYGGEVMLVEIVPGHSTTNLVQRMRSPQEKAIEQ